MLEVKRTGRAEYGLHVKALIVGPPGSGKTLTSSTWKKPLLASAEGGLMSIADRNIPYIDIRRSEDLFQLKLLMEDEADVQKKVLGFAPETFVVDTIDEIQKLLVRERLEETKKDSMEIRDWGWLGETMRAIVRGLRNLPMNVLMTCHVKETKDEGTGRVFFVPALQGAMGDEIPAYVDLAVLLKSTTNTVVEDNKTVRKVNRVLQTYPDANHPWIKDRSGKLPAEFVINFDDDYQRLFDTIYGEVDKIPEGKNPIVVQTTKPEPEPEPESVKEDLELKVEAPVEAKELVCEECKGPIENQNQADLSRIRFRKQYCRSCFVNAKRPRAKA